MEFTWTSPITAKKIYRASLIGCGRIGSILEEDPLREKPCTHAGAYFQNPNIQLDSLCDINNERLLQAQNKWKVDKGYLDHNSLFKNENPDIISIATDIKNHHNIVYDAASAKIPVILSEKPISLSLSHAGKMIDICKQNGSTLIINHERRFASDYNVAKQLIQNHEIGEIVSINGKILTGKPSKESHYSIDGGGPLTHDGTHLIDIIRFLTDAEIHSVYADMIIDEGLFVESTVYGQLLLSNGIICHIEAGGKRDYFMFDLEIWGSRGMIKIGNGYFKLFMRKSSQYYSGFNDLNEIPLAEYNYNNLFSNLMDSIVLHLENKKEIDSSGMDGYKALEAIFALYQSAISHKKITLPLDSVDETPLSLYFNKGLV